MEVRYIGPHDRVDVPIPPDAPGGGGAVTVESGGVLDTTNEHAEQLLEQTANWEAVAAVARKAKKNDTADEASEGGDQS